MAQSSGPEAALLSIANTLGGGLTDMASKVMDLVVPGLGTLAETLLQLPQKLLAAVTPFVEALNPALLIGFNTQLANLQATIGTAFENVFNILAPVLDQVASLIQSTMDALRPVIDTIVTALGTHLVEGIKSTVAMFKALMPIIEMIVSLGRILIALTDMLMVPVRMVVELLGFLIKVILAPLNFQLAYLAKALEGLSKILEIVDIVFNTILETVMQFITALIEGLGLGNIFTLLENVIKNVITVFLQLIGFIANFLGAATFLDNLIKNLKGPSHAIAAPKDVAFKGIEQITKDIAAAGFIAGGGTEKSQTDLMADGIKALEDIQKNGLTIQKLLEQIMAMIPGFATLSERVNSFKEDHPILSALPGGTIVGALVGGRGG